MSRVVHFEICADNPNRVATFYREALGWDIEGSEAEGYWLITTGNEAKHGINGGIMGKHFPQPIINTIEVASLADTTARIEQFGGKKVRGPNEIPGVGMHSYFIDSEGTMFGVLEPPKVAAAPAKKSAAKPAKKAAKKPAKKAGKKRR